VTGAELRPAPASTRRATATSPFSLEVEDLDACPRSSRASSATCASDSPLWLKARLIGAGMRPISNVVDITNYVMLALGSRSTRTTANTLRGGIVVRHARADEELVTLDGTRRKLRSRGSGDRRC